MFAAFAVAGGLTVALVWLPLPGVWWHVTRGACYLPILLVSARYGSLAGLASGMAASFLYAFAAASRGMDDMTWLSMLAPDFAVVGLLGGRFLKGWPRFRQAYPANGAAPWSRLGGTSGPDNNFDLNPIASIQTAAELLSEEDTPAHQRHELAGIISAECAHLSASIKGMLQSGPAASQPHFSETDFGAMIDAAIREIEFVLCGRGIILRKEVAPGLPAIECDPDQIRNLLMFLTINTVLSVPSGTAVVLVASCEDEGIVLGIKDKSVESFLSRSFNRFFGPRPGTPGIALAAAYDIVRRHDGRIRASLNVRKGLEFSVWLPSRRTHPNDSWQGSGCRGR
jgi:hypothetical protein